MKYKKIILTYIITASLCASVFFGTLFIYDPLKLFHNQGHYKDYIQRNMRMQAAGIINNWDFDSIILGTSMLENSSANEASEKLGGNFVNISLEGGSYFERKIILDYALRKKELKKVLYSLDYIGNSAKGPSSGIYSMSNWDYLYDYNPFNDFNAYTNDKYLKCLFGFHNKKKCMGRKINLDRPNAWYKAKFHSVRFGGLDNWFKAENNIQIKSAFTQVLQSIKNIKAGHIVEDPNISIRIKKSQVYIDENLISAVKKYPDTEFIFLLPPYSRLRYAIWAQYNKSYFKLYKESLRYIVLESEKYTNMKIYGWGTESFVDDIANYKDLGHYEYKINSWMIGAIKNRRGLLSEKNIDNYLNQITQKALHYDLSIIGDKIDNYLNPKDKK